MRKRTQKKLKAATAATGPTMAPSAFFYFSNEIRPQIKLSIPMAASQLVDGLTQQVSIMMIGHLGPEMLGAAVLATM